MAIELKGKLGEAQGQLGQFLGSKLSELKGQADAAFGPKIAELGGKASEQVSKALTPYQPLIDDATQQLGTRLSTVRELADQVSKEVSKEQEVIAPAIESLRKSATPRTVFNAENLAALPFWGAIILSPNNAAVKKLMESYIPIVFAVFAYIWMVYLALQDPVSLEGFSGMTNLSELTKGFSSETSVAVAWAHFIAQDLFVGRLVV